MARCSRSVAFSLLVGASGCQAFLTFDDGGSSSGALADAAAMGDATSAGDANMANDAGAGGDTSSGGDVVSPYGNVDGAPDVISLLCTGMSTVCDTFERLDQPGWGVTTSNDSWGGNATDSAFSILDNHGRIGPGASTAVALVGTNVGDAEVLVVGRQGVPPWFGAILRAASTDTYYFARLGNSTFTFERNNGGTVDSLGGTSVGLIMPDVEYAIRFRAQGQALSAKVWRQSATEPADWTITKTDGAFATGQAGVGAVVDASLEVSFFQVQAL